MKSPHADDVHSEADEPLESVRDFAHGWDRFWFEPSDPTTLGLMRLLGGIVVLYTYFCYSFDLLSYVSPREAWLDREVMNYLRNDSPNVTFPDGWPGQTLFFQVTDQSLGELTKDGVPPIVFARLSSLRGREIAKEAETTAQKDAIFQSEMANSLKMADLLNTFKPDDLQRWQLMVVERCRVMVPILDYTGKGQNSWSIFFHVEEPHWIWTAHILGLSVLLLFTVGFATRITSVLAFMVAIGYMWRAQTSLFGMDAMIVVFLFYMMIAPGGAALSVDRWLFVRSERKRLRDPNADLPLQPLASATFATRLIQVQFCFIYIAAGTAKLLGAGWWNGTALWACYANYSFAPMRVPLYMDFLVFLCRHRYLWEIFMTGGVMFTLFMELSFPYLIWIKRWRWLMLTGSVLLHTGIGLFMGLVTFSLVMLCLVMAFIPPEATQLFLGRVAETCRRVRQAVYGSATNAAKPLPAPAR